MVLSAIAAPVSCSAHPRDRDSFVSLLPYRNAVRFIVSTLPFPYRGSSTIGLSSDEKDFHVTNRRFGTIVTKGVNPPIMPSVMTPGGPLDLSSVLFRNRTIFIGQPITAQVAQRVISQLVTLAAIDENADILMYLNCPGGSNSSVLAIYDCMSWIKPKVSTVCIGSIANQGTLLLAGGEKGMRYSMPNARIMIQQPLAGSAGHVEEVKRQADDLVQIRKKFDLMFAAFSGQPLERVQQYTERNHFFSAAKALEFGIIDGILETEH